MQFPAPLASCAPLVPLALRRGEGGEATHHFVDKELLMDAAQDALRALDREREEMRERLEVMDGYSRTLLIMGTVLVIC